MKIIALLPVKNEEAFLSIYLSTVLPIVDEIIAIDNGSTDKTVEILKKAGVYLEKYNKQLDSSWPEYDIRNRLLELGRQRGGTHFLCLDADEAISCNFIKLARNAISELKPGQKLVMPWINLWRGYTKYYNGIAEMNKDFAFADNGDNYAYTFLGVNRTPGPNLLNRLKKVDLSKGCILHFQFIAWERFQIKQAWYCCSEYIGKNKSPAYINFIYRHYVGPDVDKKLLDVLPEWLNCLDLSDNLKTLSPDWHLDKLEQWFKKYGIVYFEPLCIWNIDTLKKQFIKIVGREPNCLRFSVLKSLYFRLRQKLGKLKIIINK